MSEVNNGLRFDIYERVHLPDNVAAIDELEEIELVPRIQVIEQGDQAVLQGQLVLNGIYRAQGAEDEQVALEHWIPVEISLPMNRVSRLEEITVDIDTFDVVLLSSRALNITGILSLRGITLEQEEEASEWESEIFTVSHERGESEEEVIEWNAEITDEELSEQSAEDDEQRQFIQEEAVESEPYYASYLQEEQSVEQVFAQTQEELRAEQYEVVEIDENFESVENVEQVETLEEEQEQSVAYAYTEEDLVREIEAQQYTADAYVEEPVYVAHEVATSHWGQFVNEAPVEQEREQQEELEYEEAQADEEIEEVSDSQLEEEVTEVTHQERSVHIALNSSSNQNETLGIRSILTSSLREQAAHQATLLQQETERQQEEASKPHVVEEEIEWQHLFLSKRPDQNEFRRIRMCIVQKEDTLEQIANRYSINPRELLVRNNLHETAISEGQLLYLP
ncbi:LysM peptidoglycan-binding domain-containing protein [Paenibacillus endoradicis]|uniref:LysM peptidoglycan-binding domain-containing protein n=1 Tax=Paenibacillus endoradicis TaxID=2972487 RepID=UPI002159206B|nr:LysM peptidoglycan-binding domain-containing protein [Paenibacillus endoradicis]MCR8655695.1 LysM peptidoglycan-binding domain-containing protein [Paenibacillus endoradicis]MCR8658021.1 LysM peptidoglycan-binding domain-containing protein [Paenibacillus endoradicis]